MRNGGGNTSTVLFGTSEGVGVGRGLAEFRAGRPVIINGGDEKVIALPVEGLDADRLTAFWQMCEPIRPRLVITGLRARSLGLDAPKPVALELAPGVDATTILALVTEAQVRHTFVVE